MHIALASQPGTPGAVNLDWAGAAACGTAVLLDGLTEAAETGCRHGTAWYVNELGTRLLSAAADPRRPLAAGLAGALSAVAVAHGGSCDLTHPGSPGATVAMVRPRVDSPHTVEYLVLSDAVVVLDVGGDPATHTEAGSAAAPTVVTDRSVDTYLPNLRESAAGTGPDGAGPPHAPLRRLIEEQQRLRNREGGYWIARAEPDAARHALTGDLTGVRAALLLSDGAALMSTDFGALTWRELIDLALDRGPRAVIAATRELEERDATRTVWPRYKVHDDATAILCDLR